MNRAALISGIILLIAATSCSNKYLEENKADWYSVSDTLFLTNNNVTFIASVQIPVDKDYDFTVFIQPRWLSFESAYGSIQDGQVLLTFGLNPDYLSDWYQVYNGSIVLDVEDFGKISIPVRYTNYGKPVLEYSPHVIVFESAYPQTLTIRNIGQGLLVWEIVKPDWLSMTETSGELGPGVSQTISLMLIPGKLTPGISYSAALPINGVHTLLVNVSEGALITPELSQVTSILTDAEFHHDSGIMAICTKSPNQLLLFNTVSGENDTIPLDKTPSCISFSEDGHKAVMGFSVASVAYVDVDKGEITAEYGIDCIPFDIAYGENGWCYITPVSDQWVMLRNLNLSTGEVVTSATATSIYEKTVIRKVPGKPFMAGSQLGLSPSSLLIFDLNAGQAKDAVAQYHESIGHFWLSKDGARLYAAYGNVYTLPAYDGQFHPSSPPVYGNIDSELAYIYALDECPSISSVFVSSSNYYWQTGNSSLIEQFNTTSLNKIKTYNVLPVWLNLAGTGSMYETTPRFIFVNKDGTAMYVIKSLKSDYNVDGWFMETIEL